MPLLFKKPLVEVTPVVEPEVELQKVLVVPQSEVEALTTEYIDLYRKFVYFEVKPMIKRMEEIRKQLHSIANETVVDTAPAVFSCAQGEMVFSERSRVVEVVNPLVLVHDLVEKFGPEVAASVVDIAITPLRKLLSEFELKAHLTESPGSRTLKTVRPEGKEGKL